MNKLAGSVYEQLKSDIFEFRLLPGTRFSENEIARRARVSRTPVREALFRLEREGYLESSLLARSMEADALVLPTGVEKVALDFNKPTQRWLDRMTLAEARRHQAEDQFDKGSMGPKVAALIDFVGGGGKLGLITDPPNVARALRGETGTRVVAK